jgi:hypothetical protein
VGLAGNDLFAVLDLGCWSPGHWRLIQSRTVSWVGIAFSGFFDQALHLLESGRAFMGCVLLCSFSGGHRLLIQPVRLFLVGAILLFRF